MQKKIWANGEITSFDKISVINHGLHYGTAVFEGIRCYDAQRPAVFRLKDHIDRLFHSAEVMGMQPPFTKEEIVSAVKEVIQENGFRECYVRPIFFYGEKMGLSPIDAPLNCFIIAWPWGKYLKKDAVSVKVSSFLRISDRSAVMTAKVSGYYANSVTASLEALKEGYDEALLLDHEGYIAEGPGENIFFVKGNTLYTPREGAILPGITRESVMQLAKEAGYGVEEKKISLKELSEYDEAFFVGTAVEVNAIANIDDNVFKGEEEVTKDIKNAYYRAVHEREEWIDYV